MSLTFRELTTDEFDSIPPEATNGIPIPKINTVAVGAINPAGEIVAVWFAVGIVHLEPLWIREDHRKSPTLLRRLWGKLRDTLVALGVQHTLTVVNSDIPDTVHIADWLGGKRLPGNVYILEVK